MQSTFVFSIKKIIEYVFFSLFLAGCFVQSLNAQSPRDSIPLIKNHEKYISTLKTKHEKLNYLLKTIDNIDFNESTISEISELFNIAISIEEYNTAALLAVESYNTVSKTYPEFQSSIILIKNLKKFEEKINDKALLYDLYFVRGKFYATYGADMSKALDFFLQARDSFYHDRKSLAMSCLFVGKASFYLGQYHQALTNYQKAEEIFGQLNNKKRQYETLGDIIGIYSELNFYDKSTIEYQKLIDKKLKEGQLQRIWIDYYNLAMSYSKYVGTVDYKESYFEIMERNLVEASKQAKREGYMDGLVLSNAYLAEMYREIDLEKADSLINVAEYYLKQSDKKIGVTSPFYIYKILNLVDNKQYTKAQKMAEEHYKRLEDNGYIAASYELDNTLRYLYETKGQFEMAHKYAGIYQKKKDSIEGIQRAKTISYYQELYDAERKERVISEAEKDIEILSQKNKIKSQLMIFGGIGLVFTFLTVLLIKNRSQIKKENRMNEKFAEDILEAQENERERVAKELHDGIGNSLFAVRYTIKNEKNIQSLELLDKTMEEVRTISKGLYPYQLERNGLYRAIETLVKQFNQNYNHIYIFEEIQEVDAHINLKQKLNIFRIVQECLSNAVKHAKASSIKVDMFLKNRSIIIIILDNGTGFNFKEQIRNISSVGLKTITSRIRALKGNFEVQSEPLKGTEIKVVIPI